MSTNRPTFMCLCGAAALFTLSAPLSASDTDGVFLHQSAAGFDSDGVRVDADSEHAELVAIELYLEVPGIKPRLLEISNVAIDNLSETMAFLHDDDRSDQGGTWRIQASNAANGWWPGMASKFDSYLTLGYGDPSWNSTQLVGSLPADDPAFIFGEQVGWINPTPENGQSDSGTDLAVHWFTIAQFVVDATEYQDCGRFDFSADVRFVDLFDDAGEVNATLSKTIGKDDCDNSIVEGDLDGDGLVTGSDLSMLLSSWGEDGGIGDINGDGQVNGIDLSRLLGLWNG
jgi:hypothetical protein